MKAKLFEKNIGYDFHDINFLEQALTHSSSNREKKIKHQDNERLEFIGDAFLDAIIGVELFYRMNEATEGQLTKIRALIVCEKALAEVAREYKLGEYIYLGHGEEATGGREKDSILADAMEAVIGAIFLDGGYLAAKKFVSKAFQPLVEKAVIGEIFSDYKSEIQEFLQKKGKPVLISYVLDYEEGPAHDKTFHMHLSCDGEKIGQGIGKSKKEAEQNAARQALEILERRRH